MNKKNLHIFIIIFGIIFLNLSVFHVNLWFDETYSVAMATHSFKEIWNIGGHDVHPILYYFVLHLFYLLTHSSSILIYRLFSALCVSILGILGYTHIRKDFGEKTGLLFSFFVYFSGVSVTYANEIRMYALTMLVITILGIYAYRLSKKDKLVYWVVFGLSSLASIYLHYYGLMSAGIINLILLIYFIKNKNKSSCIKLLFLGVIQGILYLPWLTYFISQLNTMSENGFWINITFPKTLIQILGFTFSGKLSMYVGFVLSIAIYVYLIYLIKKHGFKENTPAIFAILVYVLVIVSALIMTKILGRDILYYRYLIVVTGLMFFAISYLLSKGGKITKVICALVLVIGIFNNFSLICENYSLNNMKHIKYVKENIKEGDVIVYPSIGTGSVFDIHFPNNKQYFCNLANWGVEEAYNAFGPQMQTYITTDFLEECQGRIWLITPVNSKFYENNFKGYNIISEKDFKTAYDDYSCKIRLIEKNM